MLTISDILRDAAVRIEQEIEEARRLKAAPAKPRKKPASGPPRGP